MNAPIPAYDSTARHTAYAALFLIVIIIIIIIIIAVFAFRNQDLVVAEADRWSVTRSTTTSTSETFTAGADSIYLGSPNIPAGFVLTVQPYTGIDSVVNTDNTTIFKIVNQSSSQSININTSTTGSLRILPLNTATFMWDTATTVRMIGTATTFTVVP